MTNSNPGGPGGQRRKIQTNKPQGKTSHRKQGGGCKCFFGRAGQAARSGQFKLARRFAWRGIKHLSGVTA